jgi:hypothetical protein
VSDANAGVTDVARAISSICHALPPVTRTHLHALLAHTVAAPQPAETRARRLGLICELVTRPGRIGVPQYERLRSERVAEGWPAASTLIEHFGSWPTVLSLALRLQSETQRRAAVLASHRPHRDENLGDYNRAEVIAAIHLASETIGRIPSHAEYLEIRRVLREHARGTGSHMPRVPGTRTIKRLFADYDDAVRAASRDQSFRVGS